MSANCSHLFRFIFFTVFTIIGFVILNQIGSDAVDLANLLPVGRNGLDEAGTYFGGSESYLGGSESYLGASESYLGGSEGYLGGSGSYLEDAAHYLEQGANKYLNSAGQVLQDSLAHRV